MLHFPLQPAGCFSASEKGKDGEIEGGKKGERERNVKGNKENKEKRSLRSRQTESWWPELCVIPFMSLDWPVLLCQPKQQRRGGPTLRLLPSSLPRAHPTDRMNNKPNVCLRQRKRGT